MLVNLDLHIFWFACFSLLPAYYHFNWEILFYKRHFDNMHTVRFVRKRLKLKKVSQLMLAFFSFWAINKLINSTAYNSNIKFVKENQNTQIPASSLGGFCTDTTVISLRIQIRLYLRLKQIFLAAHFQYQTRCLGVLRHRSASRSGRNTVLHPTFVSIMDQLSIF